MSDRRKTLYKLLLERILNNIHAVVVSGRRLRVFCKIQTHFSFFTAAYH